MRTALLLTVSPSTVADLHSKILDVRSLPGGPHLSISCSFWENLAKSYVSAPWRVGAPSSGKSWIHHCSMHCMGGGGCGVGWDAWSQGRGCLLWGRGAWSQGVGGAWSGEVSAPEGSGIPACTEANSPCEQND